MIKPKTFGSLRSRTSLSERECLAAAAILPNLPDTDVLVAVRTTDPMYHEPDPIERIQKHETPIVPGGSVYRAVISEPDTARYMSVVPRPYNRREYYVHEGDVDVFVPPHPADADFETDQTTLSDFGSPSPHFETRPARRSGYRKPHLPV